MIAQLSHNPKTPFAWETCAILYQSLRQSSGCWIAFCSRFIQYFSLQHVGQVRFSCPIAVQIEVQAPLDVQQFVLMLMTSSTVISNRFETCTISEPS
jgi:hypothetical protein